MTGARRLAAVSAVLAGVGAVVGWQQVPTGVASAAPAPVAEGAMASAGLSVVDAPDATVSGAALFRAKGCATCHHGPDTTALVGESFPDLTGASAWAGERVPGLSAADYLAQSIREPWALASPQGVPAGGQPQVMPALAVSDAEVAAIVEYLLADRE